MECRRLAFLHLPNASGVPAGNVLGSLAILAQRAGKVPRDAAAAVELLGSLSESSASLIFADFATENVLDRVGTRWGGDAEL